MAKTAHPHRSLAPPAVEPPAAPTPPPGEGGLAVGHKRVSWSALGLVVGLIGAIMLFRKSGGGSTLIQQAAPSTNPAAASSQIGLPVAGNVVTPSTATGGGNWWDSLYQSIGRTQNADGSYGDAGGQQFWSSETAVKGQAAAVGEFLATPEAAVQNDYLSSLGRKADAGGLQFWEQQITSGSKTEAQVAAAIASSTEAKNRALTAQ